VLIKKLPYYLCAEGDNILMGVNFVEKYKIWLYNNLKIIQTRELKKIIKVAKDDHLGWNVY
jgi:hypothetical protein